jgi:hypothetical protein
MRGPENLNESFYLVPSSFQGKMNKSTSLGVPVPGTRYLVPYQVPFSSNDCVRDIGFYEVTAIYESVRLVYILPYLL